MAKINQADFYDAHCRIDALENLLAYSIAMLQSFPDDVGIRNAYITRVELELEDYFTSRLPYKGE